MKIILVTQDEPFYLRDPIGYLLDNLPVGVDLCGVVLLGQSPSGRKMGFLERAWDTLKIFGPQFSLYYGIQLVVSKISKSGLRDLFVSKGIPIIRLNESINNESSLRLIKEFKPDLLVSIQGNEVFKRPLIELAPKGCINLHTALLPKYRGLMPTFWVIKNQEKETGVSVFFVDEGIDSGPIIVQRRVKLSNKSQRQLIKETKQLGMEAIIEGISLIKQERVQLMLNDNTEMTYFGFPTREDVVEFRKVGGRFF